ncbi:hypothetical protein VNI00_003689 [Paramarasmius palmivorus]|uniref:Uncharacterized protein n=1 Tax=Paramarasmius palmivorus TaxID=297713 RepID=A0AAW0DRJ3_9AGAR
MQFRVQVLLLAALASIVAAAPAPAEVEARQNCQTIFFPNTCPAGQTACNASGAIILCCNSC